MKKIKNILSKWNIMGLFNIVHFLYRHFLREYIYKVID